jgi:hypothetical protein
LKKIKQLNPISEEQQVDNFLSNKNFQYSSSIANNLHNVNQVSVDCSHQNREIREHHYHAAGEYCADCGRWFRWLKRKEYDAVLNSANTRLIGGAA